MKKTHFLGLSHRLPYYIAFVEKDQYSCSGESPIYIYKKNYGIIERRRKSGH
jgi:hypothetical protein